MAVKRERSVLEYQTPQTRQSAKNGVRRRNAGALGPKGQVSDIGCQRAAPCNSHVTRVYGSVAPRRCRLFTAGKLRLSTTPFGWSGRVGSCSRSPWYLLAGISRPSRRLSVTHSPHRLGSRATRRTRFPIPGRLSGVSFLSKKGSVHCAIRLPSSSREATQWWPLGYRSHAIRDPMRGTRGGRSRCSHPGTSPNDD